MFIDRYQFDHSQAGLSPASALRNFPNAGELDLSAARSSPEQRCSVIHHAANNSERLMAQVIDAPKESDAAGNDEDQTKGPNQR